VWTWCPAAAGAAALRPWSRVLRKLAGGHAAAATLSAPSRCRAGAGPRSAPARRPAGSA
jgi:hypothetical protein